MPQACSRAAVLAPPAGPSLSLPLTVSPSDAITAPEACRPISPVSSTICRHAKSVKMRGWLHRTVRRALHQSQAAWWLPVAAAAAARRQPHLSAAHRQSQLLGGRRRRVGGVGGRCCPAEPSCAPASPPGPPLCRTQGSRWRCMRPLQCQPAPLQQTVRPAQVRAPGKQAAVVALQERHHGRAAGPAGRLISM